MCRLAAAHETVRLMLLESPPDMVHGVSLHRARTPIFRRNEFLDVGRKTNNSFLNLFNYIIMKKIFQVFAKKFLKNFFDIICQVSENTEDNSIFKRLLLLDIYI